MRNRVVAIALAVVLVPRIADAGLWYYKWSCSGRCAPGRLAISGHSPGFATKDQCESVRWSDSRREEFVAEGNLGGLTSCEEYEGEPVDDASGSSGGGRAAPFQRFVLGAVAGPGWFARDTTTSYAKSDRTIGGELGLVFGGRPIIGLETSVGFHRIEVTAPVYGAAPKAMTVVPWNVGFTSSPALAHGRKLEARLDLGVDISFLFRTGCDACDSDGAGSGFALALRSGLDLYFGEKKTVGLGFDALFMFGKLGDVADEIAPTTIELVPPQMIGRVSLIVRNGDLYW